MEYIINENDKVVKYDIKYDIPTLQKLRKEISEKCGIRRHIKEEKIDKEIAKEDFLIENLSIEDVEYKDYYLYLLNYYLIEEPELSKIIKQFIDGNIEGLINLIHFNILKDNKIDFDKENSELKRLVEYYKENNQLDRLDDILCRIKTNIEDKIYNERLNLSNQNEFILKLKSLLIINKLDEMDYDLYNKAMNFSKNVKILELNQKI